MFVWCNNSISKLYFMKMYAHYAECTVLRFILYKKWINSKARFGLFVYLIVNVHALWNVLNLLCIAYVFHLPNVYDLIKKNVSTRHCKCDTPESKSREKERGKTLLLFCPQCWFSFVFKCFSFNNQMDKWKACQKCHLFSLSRALFFISHFRIIWVHRAETEKIASTSLKLVTSHTQATANQTSLGEHTNPKNETEWLQWNFFCLLHNNPSAVCNHNLLQSR